MNFAKMEVIKNSRFFHLMPLVLIFLAIGCGKEQIRISVQTTPQDVVVKLDNAVAKTTRKNGSLIIQTRRPDNTGFLQLEFEKEGYKPEKVSLEVTNETEYSLSTVNLKEIARHITIRAFKVDKSGEFSPIAGAKVSILVDGQKQSLPTTNIIGSLTKKIPLNAQKATVTIEHHEPDLYPKKKEKQVNFEEDKEEYFVEFLFIPEQPITISLTCVDQKGRPIYGVSISYKNQLLKKTNAKGEAQVILNNVKDDNIRLHFSHTDFYPKDKSVKVEKDKYFYSLRVVLREIDPRIKKLRTLIKKEYYEEALSLFKEIPIEEIPLEVKKLCEDKFYSHADALLLDADESLKEEKADKAIPLYQKAIYFYQAVIKLESTKPELKQCYLGLGWAYYETKEYENAKEAVTKGLAVKPSDKELDTKLRELEQLINKYLEMSR